MTTLTPGAILRYRVLAYVTGVFLLILTLVVIPLQLWAHNTVLVKPVSLIHGYGYMAYLVVALDLALRARWSPLRTIFILLAGTIPFAAFFTERYVVQDSREKLVAAQAKKAAKAARSEKVTPQPTQTQTTPEPANAE